MHTQYHRGPGLWTRLGGLNQIYGPNRPISFVKSICGKYINIFTRCRIRNPHDVLIQYRYIQNNTDILMILAGTNTFFGNIYMENNNLKDCKYPYFQTCTKKYPNIHRQRYGYTLLFIVKGEEECFSMGCFLCCKM